MNKNTNGLIKQYFTKGSSFENITESQVRGGHTKTQKLTSKNANTSYAEFFGNDNLQPA